MNIHIFDQHFIPYLYRNDKIQSLGIKDVKGLDFEKPSEIQHFIFKDVDKIFLLTPNFDTKDISKN
ncbi:MAG: hypothetical protein ABJB76_05960 [Candidatus Nitrosocosmicus sp.]